MRLLFIIITIKLYLMNVTSGVSLCSECLSSGGLSSFVSPDYLVWKRKKKNAIYNILPGVENFAP